MTQDEIIEMVRQAEHYADTHLPLRPREWKAVRDKRFAELVAAKERDACALTAENCTNIYHDTPAHIAKAIRARGEV